MSLHRIVHNKSWCPKCGIKQRANTQKNIFYQKFKNKIKEKKAFFKEAEYINGRTRVKVKCSEGHLFLALPTQIVSRGTWCPTCSIKVTADKNRGDISLAYKLAKKNNGKCLSTDYIGIKSHLEWECKDGHRWKTSCSSIKKGSWCPYCANKVKLSIELAVEIARQKGGMCLSKKYKNNHSNLTWECSEGHTWKASLKTIKNRGSWCLICSGGEKYSIKDVIKFAKSMGGKCLDKEYKNANFKLEFQCSEGHTWKAPFSSLKNCGTWCPKCGKIEMAKKSRISFNKLDELAKKNGGKILSKEYQNNKIPLDWQCKKGHKFKKTFNQVSSKGEWCQVCSKEKRSKK